MKPNRRWRHENSISRPFAGFLRALWTTQTKSSNRIKLWNLRQRWRRNQRRTIQQEHIYLLRYNCTQHYSRNDRRPLIRSFSLKVEIINFTLFRWHDIRIKSISLFVGKMVNVSIPSNSLKDHSTEPSRSQHTYPKPMATSAWPQWTDSEIYMYICMYCLLRWKIKTFH